MSRTRQLGLIWTVALVLVAVIGLWPESAPVTSQTTRTPTLDQPAPTFDQVGQGKALFTAKGCFSCHIHRDVNTQSVAIGPDLTNYRGDPAFLRQWLADPSALRPDTKMPNLNLSDAEIEALIAFLTQSKP